MISTIKKILSRLQPSQKDTSVHQQEQIPLYENAIPNSHQIRNKEYSQTRDNVLRIYKVSVPTLTVFRPAVPNGMAVIICPGGAYALLSFSKEGTSAAIEMSKWGITAFVLKYRLPDDSICIDKSLAPLQDAQQAMRLVRKNAVQWGINENRIGIMGFSAGAHLASALATHLNFKADPANNDTTNVRPDFNILIYPVMNLDSNIAHVKSRDNLTGKNASADILSFFSNEQHVSASTPPTFLVHAEDDTSVPVENCSRFYDACIKNNVPAEIHIYPQGGHGFGTINKTSKDSWMDKLRNWLDRLYD